MQKEQTYIDSGAFVQLTIKSCKSNFMTWQMKNVVSKSQWNRITLTPKLPVPRSSSSWSSLKSISTKSEQNKTKRKK